MGRSGPATPGRARRGLCHPLAHQVPERARRRARRRDLRQDSRDPQNPARRAGPPGRRRQPVQRLAHPARARDPAPPDGASTRRARCEIARVSRKSPGGQTRPLPGLSIASAARAGGAANDGRGWDDHFRADRGAGRGNHAGRKNQGLVVRHLAGARSQPALLLPDRPVCRRRALPDARRRRRASASGLETGSSGQVWGWNRPTI